VSTLGQLPVSANGEHCGATEKTLHVHHKYYEKGLKPWEYPDTSLHCLCADCHKSIQAVHMELNRQIGRLDLSDLDVLLGYARGLEMAAYPMVACMPRSYEEAMGIAACWGLSADQVISSLDDEKRITGYTLDKLKNAEPSGPANGSQPSDPDSNPTSAAAGSRR